MDELLGSPPNGVHDAELTALAVDYARAEVTASVVLDFSDPDDPALRARREALGSYPPASRAWSSTHPTGMQRNRRTRSSR